MMIRYLISYIAIFILIPWISQGQEVISGLQSNKALSGKNSHAGYKGITADPVELPFIDDFTGRSNQPSSVRWADNYAFVNNTYSDRQLTKGMATLDALDNTGRLYETANQWGFEADHLTSQPVNLEFAPSQNIWLSFFYQAGGLGDPPETADSLTLQFFAPDEGKWYSVWRTPGSQPHEFIPVIIRIEQPRFLKRGFQFRFVNWASLSGSTNDPSIVGNCDLWNIDYISLDRNRNEADTILADVAFRLPLRSVLKTYEAMPWNQFREIYLQEMGAAISVHYRNNDTIIRNVTRNFNIRNLLTNTLDLSFTAGATNIDPRANVNYNASLIYTFNTPGNDSARFRITAYLVTDEFDPKTNDTLQYDQVFSNYFAFDDGSAEGGYGINGQGSRNAMFACRFRSYIQDTIRAISICFNDSYLNSNLRAFDLMVWNDNNDLPGDILYSAEEQMVIKEADINGFFTYFLPDPVMVDGVFYVGWKQRTETFLNAGYDVNTPNEGRQLYWLNGAWLSSQVEGSVMIRPVVGKKMEPTSVAEPLPETGRNFRLWPNPATDHVNLRSEELKLAGSAYVSFIDIYGREVMKVPFSEQINISSLRPGVYTVITAVNGKPAGYRRLVKTR